jgi:prophage antirepressor-like protein
VRTTVLNGEPWFLAKDVCTVLEISKYRDAVSRLDEDERGSVLVDTPGGPQEMAAISEPGLYSLIMVSRKPEAKMFKRWITHEVLPQIRQTGGYIAPQSPTQALLQAVHILAEQEKKIQQLEENQQILQHRINNLDQVNIQGDKQQILNAVIRKYALNNGLAYSTGWKHFVQNFNTAFRTNLELLKTNYPKKVSTPQYLAALLQEKEQVEGQGYLEEQRRKILLEVCGDISDKDVYRRCPSL